MYRTAYVYIQALRSILQSPDLHACTVYTISFVFWQRST